MSSLFTTIIAGIFKAIVPYVGSQSKSKEIYSYILKSLSIIIILSILISAVIVLGAIESEHYLERLGFSNYESFGIIMGVGVSLISICILLLRSYGKKIEGNDQESEHSRSYIGGITKSFMDGYNS